MPAVTRLSFVRGIDADITRSRDKLASNYMPQSKLVE